MFDKRCIRLILIIIILTHFCWACTSIPVASVSISKPSLIMIEGESEQLTATVDPESASDYTIDWESSNPDIASVNNGYVKAIKEGHTSITVSAGGKTASCSVTVLAKYIPVSSITVYPTFAEMVEGDELALTVSVEPADANDKSLLWSSSDNNVVSVNEGKLTAKSVGNAKITVKAGEKTATCDIAVVKKVIHVESISLNLSQKRLKKGEKVTITAIVHPENANNFTISYSSANPDVASVSQDGIVEGLSSGKTTISVEAEGNKTDVSIIVFEQDVIYAMTTDYNYTYYVSKLWKNQDPILTARDYTFKELYIIDNKPTIIAHLNTRTETEYYQIINGYFQHFNPGAESPWNICNSTTLYNGDIYSIVEWDNLKAGVWKNTEKLFDLGDEYKMSAYSQCSFRDLFFDGGEMYIFGCISEPVSEASKASFPTIWKDGAIYKQFDIREPNASLGGDILDIEIIDGKRYYLMRRHDGQYWQNHLAVYDDNGKLYDLCPEAESSGGSICSYNGKLYAISTSSFSGSNELRLSVYEDGILLFTLPNIESAAFDIVDGDIYLLAIERRLWGGVRYYSESVYRGENKEYTIIEDTTDALYLSAIKVFKGR